MVSFSLESYQISHTIASMKSVGDKMIISTFALCFSHGEEKAGNTNPSCSETRSKIKAPFTQQIPLLLPTTSQIQELSTQFLHIQ